MFKRIIELPVSNSETFFLWGPRQTGKSTLLRATYPDAHWIDLLKADEYRRYMQNPELLRQELEAMKATPFIVIDEIQKIPDLLDEVHWLHENRGVHFALCGSSARKVKRGHANLLGGRAMRYELSGLTFADVKDQWDLKKMLNNGYLPRIHLSKSPGKSLSAYVGDYLKEEVAAEGLVNNLPAFSNFLSMAAISDTEIVNYSNIARDCGVSSPTVRGYFQILEDTLLCRWLPSYKKRAKRRVIASSKLYFFDIGVVNFLTKRGEMSQGSSLFGKAFENYCFHELNAYNSYMDCFEDLYYWRLASGIEVDFVVGDMKIAIEAKSSAKINDSHLKGLRQLKIDHPKCLRRIVVSLEPRARLTNDGIEILPIADFLTSLWEGDLF